jgi:hypothetical protein
LLWGSGPSCESHRFAVGKHGIAENCGKLAQNGGKLARVVENFGPARVASWYLS